MRAVSAEGLEARDIVSRYEIHRRKPLQRIVNIVDLFRDQFKLIGGQIFGDHTPFAIEDEAANGGHGLNTNAVAL